LYGSLAVFSGRSSFPKVTRPRSLASVATFGAGFGVRPLGAVVFGHIGDLIGRKYTFLVTMATMGLSTAMIGVSADVCRVGLGCDRVARDAAALAGPRPRR
jgi:MFS family permease